MSNALFNLAHQVHCPAKLFPLSVFVALSVVNNAVEQLHHSHGSRKCINANEREKRSKDLKREREREKGVINIKIQ